MTRAIKRRSTTPQDAAMSDLYLLLALLGMPMMLLLYWILQQSNPNWSRNISSIWQQQPVQPGSNNLKPGEMRTLPDGRQARVIPVTHQAICTVGIGSLNIRPRSTFETPIAQIPCDGGVAVTGAPVWSQGESWSPVVYGTTRGWSVSRLLRKV